jgi:hypothetical protein
MSAPRKIIVIKRNQTDDSPIQDEGPKLSIVTNREKFRSIISPFLLNIHIKNDESEPYNTENVFVPNIPNQQPVQVYTWLDASIWEIIEKVLESSHASIPDEYNDIVISSVYVLDNKCLTSHLLTLRNATPADKQKTLYEYKLEIGDHLEFSFE